MCDSDFEKFFRLRPDDDPDISRITEDFGRLMMAIEDDDDDDMSKMIFVPQHPSAFSSSTHSAVNDANSNTNASGELQQQRCEAKGAVAAVAPPNNAQGTVRAAELGETHSFSSSHSRGQPQLTSSEMQTPIHTSNEDSISHPQGFSAASSGYTGELSSQKFSSALMQDPAARPAPSHSQEDCPPPYGWMNNALTKSLQGMAAMPKNHQNTRAQAFCAVPPSHPSTPLPHAAYAPGTQIIPGNTFPVGLQTRPMMFQQAQPPPQQQQQQQQAQPAPNSAILQSLSMNHQAKIVPPPGSPSSQTSLQPQLQPLQQQPQQQLQYVSGVSPPGYAQVLVPTQTVDGGTGYQLMMISTQQIPRRGSSFTPQVTQSQVDQPQPPPQTNQQQPPTMMQYVWQPQPPPQQQQAQNQHQHHLPPLPSPQQPGPLPQQFMSPQYVNLANSQQRYTIVSANGQQQYVMALTMNQLQQVQQQQQLQQQAQKLQQPARPVFLTNQQSQLMFTTSMFPSAMPPGYRLN